MNTRFCSRSRWSRTVVITLVFGFCLSPLPVCISSAQTTAGGIIEGNALDPNGAGVLGATVTVTGAGGVSVSATANEDGVFRLTQLTPGRYTVVVEAPGFKRFEQANVEVNLSKPTKLNVTLNPAGITGTANVLSESGDALVTGTKIPPRELTPTRPVSVGDALEFKVDTTKFGNVKAYLPNDIRPGDTVSGSFAWDKPPVGATESFKVTSSDVAVTSTGNDFTMRVPAELAPLRRNYASLAVLVPSISPGVAPEKATLFIPLNNVPLGVTPADLVFPPLGQQGRAIQIQGPFDGNSDNTRITVGEGTGKIIKPLAESPRKVVFIAPVDVTGPYTIDVKEGDKTFTGKSRNIAVNLSAPKTNLLRGEKTTVTIQVDGLSGIIKDVPLQLDARGVINMEGGNFQNLRIKPEEVKLDGRYTTNRTITGLQAGGFSVTATVIVGPFDICLQDDVDPNRIFHFNSFTGDYSFTNLGPADQSRTSGLKLQPGGGGGAGQTGKLQPGGSGGGAAQTGAGSTSQTGSTPGDVTLTGIGKPAMKGCIITLSHNAPDRRVFARLDTCTKTGDAKVETKTPKTTSEVADKNTENNTCPSSPK